MSTIVIVLICVGAAALILLSTIRVVKESTVAIVERNGRFKRVLHPGVRFVLPILDKIAKRVSTKQYMVDFPAQFATTKNGVTIKVGVLANLQIIDPKLFVYEVENPREMTERFLFDFLRKNIAALPLRELFIKQGIIDNRVRTRLNAVTKKWGVRVNNIMLHNIEIPRAINDTLQENFAIEYEKRGKIMRAQANRVAMMTEAEGQAKAIKRIVSSKPNREYITLKSMEMLERLSTGGAATFDAPKNLDDVSEFVEKVSSGKALTLINKSPEIRESKADKAEAPSVDEFARQALGVEKSLERELEAKQGAQKPENLANEAEGSPKSAGAAQSDEHSAASTRDSENSKDTRTNHKRDDRKKTEENAGGVVELDASEIWDIGSNDATLIRFVPVDNKVALPKKPAKKPASKKRKKLPTFKRNGETYVQAEFVLAEIEENDEADKVENKS